MASNYYVCIKLNVHYQQFLRQHFQCEKEVFEFPNKHKFNTLLEHLVSHVPEGWVEPESSRELFKIALPELNYKHPYLYHYLSYVKETILKQKIRQYYDFIIEEKIKQLMKADKTEDGGVLRLNRQECTEFLIEEYEFDQSATDAFDRLYKFITRYRKNEINRKYYHKKQKDRIRKYQYVSNVEIASYEKNME
jgi:hypothetical protein